MFAVLSNFFKRVFMIILPFLLIFIVFGGLNNYDFNKSVILLNESMEEITNDFKDTFEELKERQQYASNSMHALSFQSDTFGLDFKTFFEDSWNMILSSFKVIIKFLLYPYRIILSLIQFVTSLL